MFFDKVISKYQCEFRKSFSAHHCLRKLLEQWKKSIDQGLVFCALLADLPKAFDCVSHGLLVAKLSAYGMEDLAVRSVSDYLINRKQRTKIGRSYSSWRDNLESVIKQLEQTTKLLLQWYSDSKVKGNEDKWHVLISTKEKVCVNIGTTQVTNSKCEKLLGITIDSNLNFEDHIASICKKVGAKLNALTRIANHMPFQKRKVLMNASLHLNLAIAL